MAASAAMLAVSTYTDDQVYTIIGRAVAGNDEDKSAFVVAESASQAVETLAEWGFRVTSMASLADVALNLEILEAISTRSPRVSPEEFLDLMPAAPAAPRIEEQVFTFVGRAISAHAEAMQAGFAVAADRDALTDYLLGYGFMVYSVMNCAEVRDLHATMRSVADGSDEDPSSTINFLQI